ncbi:hypothetical protein Gpo141_00010296 [Globisporangium polare]
MTATTDYKLFTPLTLGKGLTLKNRVVVAPMTRGRSDPVTRSPVEINELYYEQRSGAGLIIAEAASVSDQGHGWYGSPGMYNEEHAAAWKKVVDRVHAKDSKIFSQIWHMGRQGHSSFSAKGELVSASAIKMPGDGMTKNNKGEAVPYETPHALTTDEIAGVIEDFRKSAALAKAAGFDGVEVHGANGHLVDQFLQAASNTRTDQYGGSYENRARFVLEIVAALKSVWPADRIGLRFSPNSSYGGMGSADNAEFFAFLFKKLSHHGLSYVAMLDGFGFGYQHAGPLVTPFDVKKHFKGAVLANCSYTRDTAEGVVHSGAADFVSFGRPYISNPDLAERFANDWPLNPEAGYDAYWDASKGASDYIDFPFYKA